MQKKIRIDSGVDVVVTKPGLKCSGNFGRVLNVRFGMADVEFKTESGKVVRRRLSIDNLKVKDNRWPVLPGIAVIFTDDSSPYFQEFRTKEKFEKNGVYCENAVIIPASTLEDVEEAVHKMQDESCKNSEFIKENSDALYVLFNGVMYDLLETVKVRFSLKESNL